MTIAIICTALLGALIFGLGFVVSWMRGRTGVNFGYTPNPTDRLYKWVRAHGNTTEYAPMLAVLILLVGSREPSTWALWMMGIATASRYLHTLGLILAPSLDRPEPLRFLGALGTYLCGLGLCASAFLTL